MKQNLLYESIFKNIKESPQNVSAEKHDIFVGILRFFSHY